MHLSSPLTDQSILVTGGSEAFGQAFVRRALDEGARRVVVFSRGEAKQAEMKAAVQDDRLRFVIGDVRDATRVLDACRAVDIVVHAAALKRVEVCEADPTEAAATNIAGTINVARACIERGVAKAVLLSTDKAAAPNTLYGATKLAAERLWNASNVYAAGTPTRFATTRYGNVLGSTGSVIPTWRRQADVDGAISITDPLMSRFWMRMDDAVDLVVRALRLMRGGETFVPKLGGATVLRLARAVAPEATPRITGARPGEKIHETLISSDEARSCYDCGTHYLLEPPERTWADLPAPLYPKVPAGFSYRSDTTAQITPDELSALVAA